MSRPGCCYVLIAWNWSTLCAMCCVKDYCVIPSSLFINVYFSGSKDGVCTTAIVNYLTRTTALQMAQEWIQTYNVLSVSKNILIPIKHFMSGFLYSNVKWMIHEPDFKTGYCSVTSSRNVVVASLLRPTGYGYQISCCICPRGSKRH